MLILDSEAAVRQLPKLNLKKSLLYTSVLLGATILIAPAFLTFSSTSFSSPTGTYLDPRPQNLQAEAPTPTVPQTSPEQLILTAQAYLEKAVTLSQKTDQNSDDKTQIVTFLNQSLDFSNQAVLSAPNAPQSYLIRARVLASSSSIRADAVQLAQKDLEIAQRLSGGQSVELPTQVNLLNLSPTQQAALAQNLIVAAPAESAPAATTSAGTASNVVKSTITIKAGEIEIAISNPSITADAYLYTVNTSGSNTQVYLKSKDIGKATIGLLTPASTDVVIEYWIVKP